MKKKIVIIVGVAVVALGAILIQAPGGKSKAKSESPVSNGKGASLFTPKKGPLRVTITTNGSLKAKNSKQIRSEIHSEGKITFLIPEGTQVKEGDLLVDMDKAETQKQVDQLDMNRIQNESELASAKTEVEIQKADNQGNIEKAQLKLEFAKLNLEKYEKGEAPQERRRLQLAVDKAISEEGRAQDKFESMPELLKEGFVTKVEVEEERFRYEAAKTEVQSSQLALDLFDKYTFPMTLRQKQSDVIDAQRDYERAVQRSQSLTQQKEAVLSQRERQMKSVLDQLDRSKKELGHMTINSPGTGIVVYGDPEQGWWGGERLKVGGRIWGNQVVMTLPDLSEAQVLVNVHETDITKVALGQTVTITCDTYPGRIFSGKITKIAALARNDGWGDDAVKKFPIEVTLDGKDHNLKPGVSAKCEILVETLENVLFVPLQSVFVAEGKHHCYVADGKSFKSRPVKLGKSNDNFIVIDEGLSEGEEVALFNPETGEDGSTKEEEKKEKEEDVKPAAMPKSGQ